MYHTKLSASVHNQIILTIYIICVCICGPQEMDGNYNFTRDRLTHHVNLIRLQQLIKRVPFLKITYFNNMCHTHCSYIYVKVGNISSSQYLYRFTIRQCLLPHSRRSLFLYFINFYPLSCLPFPHLHAYLL